MDLRCSFARTVVARWVVASIVIVTVSTGCGGNPAPNLPGALSAAGPLLNSIGTAVPGLSQAQSILGLGSLLGLAKAKMPAAQFGQISSALPGADALIGEAVKQGLPSALGSLADITGFLSKSGISASQVTQMIPVVTQALSGKISPDLVTAFAGALK